MTDTFRALVLDQADGQTVHRIQDLPGSSLREGEVVVDVLYSTLNYKDGLAITGAGRIVKEFPFVPGIDLAGTVRSTESPAFKEGDPVVLTGWGVGEKHWGGLAQRARVKAEWLLPLPEGLSPRQAMSIGTAGFTAMLATMALEEQGVTPASGPVLVTGAAGGVGSIAIMLLAKRGFEVTASSGRAELRPYLEGLGAAKVVGRDALEPIKPPLGSQQWAGAVDSVGGATLATILKTTKYHGAVAACGLAGGAEVATSVFPFILRGARLIGIDSVYCPEERRRRAWARLAEDLDLARLDELTTVIPLEQAPRVAGDFLKGAVQGRVVVDVNA